MGGSAGGSLDTLEVSRQLLVWTTGSCGHATRLDCVGQHISTRCVAARGAVKSHTWSNMEPVRCCSISFAHRCMCQNIFARAIHHGGTPARDLGMLAMIEMLRMCSSLATDRRIGRCAHLRHLWSHNDRVGSLAMHSSSLIVGLRALQSMYEPRRGCTRWPLACMPETKFH